MSEVQQRPSAPRGRSSARGGRAGFGSRGGRGGRGHATNGDRSESTNPIAIEDEGEVGQLKKKYGSKVGTIKEMFPDWTDEDAVFALQETDGDLETTVERITDGKTPCVHNQMSRLSCLPQQMAVEVMLLAKADRVSRYNHTMGRGIEEQEGSVAFQGQGHSDYDAQ